MTIIGLTGKMGSGKDTVGAILVDRGYKRIAFADALKATAYDINPIVGVRVMEEGIVFERLQDLIFDHGWERAKRANPEVRRFLQSLGVAARDNVLRSIWVDAALEDMRDEDENIVITDVRFPDEAQMVVHAGGTVYRVVRPGFDGDSHATETALDKYDFPVIDNSGSLEDLRAVVAGIGV